jgi:hypothetical protein
MTALTIPLAHLGARTCRETIAPPIDLPLKQAVLGLGNLTDHFEHLQARLYTEPA